MNKEGCIYILGILLTITIVLGFSSCTVIDPDERGLRVTLGEVRGNVMSPGVNFKAPLITQIKTFKVSAQKYTNKYDVFSKDLQSVEIDIDVIYNATPEKVDLLVTKYTNNPTETILAPTISECIKQICKSRNAEKIVSERDLLRNELITMLKERVKEYEVFQVQDVLLNNMELSAKLNQSIEDKMVKEQEALKAEFEKQRKEKEAEIARVEAEGRANALREEAKGKADAIKLEAEAKATAIKIVAEAEANAISQKGEALKKSPEALKEITIKAWDGKLPHLWTDGNNLPFGIVLDNK